MTDHRRDPDAFLARAKEEEARKRQGRLKLFFGAAAGVGKTYAMLEAARELRADDVDVVVGIVETHGRAETAALLEGLTVLPPRLIEYRGATFREFDLDGALARRPAVILVDELAHTNAEGSRHRKRWQDVLELLDAGITVYTTLNVQHVESLNDVVAKITGVVVRETVPDSVLERADEIELVDLPPDDLLERLHEGKVYVPAQAQEAIENFFRKGNLIALRELALRRTAERVDAQMQAYRQDHAIGKTWPVAERILVCVSPSPFSPQLVRAGHRLAHRLGAQWIVAYVETPAHARLSQIDRDRVVQTLRLAESLGAESVTLTGATMSEEILAYARVRNVSKIVIGKPMRSLWKRIVLGSVVDALVRGSGEIDIHVVSGEGAPTHLRPLRPRPPTSDWTAYALALAVVAGCSAAAWVMFPHVGLSNLIMVYLLGVVGVATRTSRGPTVLASVLSVLTFDFFFVPPYLSFAISDTEHLLTFFVMLTVALVTSGMTVRIRAQAAAARLRERRIGALYGMSRELASGRGVESLLDTALRHVGEVFAGQLAMLLPDAGHLTPRRARPEAFALGPTDLGVAQWAFEHREVAGLGTATVPGARVLCVPLLASRGAVGVLAIEPAEPHAFDAPEALHQLETFANQTALAIERAQLANEAQAAELRAETERMRNSLLSSVSHDLRTPLATIIGASSGLLEGGDRLSSATRRDLVRSIHGEASHLDRLVNGLLEMTRLESGAVTIKAEPQALDGVVGAALQRLDTLLRDRVVQVSLPADLPLVPIDALLMEQVFLNLLDNAARYSPPGSPIDIAASAAGLKVVVEVSDRGPGFASGDETRAFEKFYRGRTAGTRGVGLGLAICRAIVQAHGGTIVAENRPGGGAIIRFTLPREEPLELPDAGARAPDAS